MASTTPRRTVLAAALAAAASAAAPAAAAAPRTARPADKGTEAAYRPSDAPIDFHAWTTHADWHCGAAHGTWALDGDRPGLVIGSATGTFDYADPHTGRTSSWETATWTSPVRTPRHPAGELVPSWNADVPSGTWIQIELSGTYNEGGNTPWYVMGRWAAGDTDIRRTSVDDQGDGRSAVWTDTLSVNDLSGGLRLVSYRFRLTLYRKPGTRLTPKVRLLGAMASDLPDRFTVPASTPGVGAGIELPVPRYSQEIHKGRYPEYDNGGEAWCSPASSQMVIEYWGRHPTTGDLAWVDPAFTDPQVCQAARSTYDHQYAGCGNWPFNAAYAAACPGLSGVVTRLRSMDDLELLIGHGIPVITSQSFLETELDGAGYGTAGHLMTVIGFTPQGDVIANDPASPDDASVRRVYDRRAWENIWLRTKRYNADGEIRGGTGGIAYLYWPAEPAPGQLRALGKLGIR